MQVCLLSTCRRLSDVPEKLLKIPDEINDKGRAALTQLTVLKKRFEPVRMAAEKYQRLSWKSRSYCRFKCGSDSNGTIRVMLRAWPGTRRMNPRRSNVSTI